MRGEKLDRRGFFTAAGLGAVGLAAFGLIVHAAEEPSDVPGRKFFAVLGCGRVGVKASFREAADLAVKHGFQGVDPDAGYFAQLSDDDLRRLPGELKSKNLKLGAVGLPVDFRKGEMTFSEGLEKLPPWEGLLRPPHSLEVD